MSVLLWGPSGCGKTEVGRVLAQRMNIAFVDADALHPRANVMKMARGDALDDIDRMPWLARVAEQLIAWRAGGRRGVVACSALRLDYRDILRGADPALTAVYLQITREIARKRLATRSGHFMPVALIDSQFETLQPPHSAEDCLVIHSTGGVEEGARLIHEAILQQY